ncbi:MAG TPA: MOSC N-terminal beta barrel domain-containing protein, partial [Chitinophagaceae bacterium]|nr:MOSC N-terminal beta barrel domain-containing protein [Chitinophagaceae bacterium]
SLAGFEVDEAVVTDRGLQYDRRWMLVDRNHCFLTQREYPQMCLLQTAISGNDLVVYHKQDPFDRIIVPVNNENKVPALEVRVWDDVCTALPVSAAADEWFTRHLSLPCQLVYMPESTHRQVDLKYAQPGNIAAFSDAYPLLVIGQASLDDLNNRLPEPLPIERFRPNLVFTGGSPYDEDAMNHIKINGLDMYGVKLCARCTIPTINPSTAGKGKEPLTTLAAYRSKDNKIYFGQNVLIRQTGLIKKGNAIQVISTRELIRL